VWGQGFGGHNKTDGEVIAGTTDTTSRVWGFAAGADYRATPNTVLGFALAGGELKWSLAQGLGGGKADVFQAGGYASHRFGNAYVSAAIAYAWHDMSTDRTVTIAGTDMLRAEFDAHRVGGRIEAGYRFAMRQLGITPYAAAQAQRFKAPAYGEFAVAGLPTFALAYSSRSTTATRLELGSWFDTTIPFANGNVLALRGRAAWAHDDDGSGGIGAVFLTLPGSNFIVNGAAPPSDLALLFAGVELRLSNGLSLGARFDGELAGRAQTYAGAGTVRYSW
jgi:outer membrane autotransporter protein